MMHSSAPTRPGSTKKRIWKKHWRYQKFTTRFLHWLWIFGFLAFGSWSIYYGWSFSSEPPPMASMAIQDPHLYSISKAGDPYHIYARSMVVLASRTFSFDHPWAKYTLPNQTLTVKSEKGLWHDANSILVLEHNVKIYDNHGQVIETEQAKLCYQSKEITSQHPTQGTGPRGQFSSNGFSWTEKELHLNGPVSITLHTQTSGTEIPVKS